MRPGRFNIQPATWITELAKKRDDLEVEFIDLADLNLPFLDEPKTPMMGDYVKEHTKAWAKTIGEADGFIFVTAEYNHSVSPVLANAISFLNAEWNYKPVSFASYGSQAGGARAVEHLRGIAGELRMFDLREQVLIPNYYFFTDDKGNYTFTEADEKAAETMLDELSTWAAKIKQVR